MAPLLVKVKALHCADGDVKTHHRRDSGYVLMKDA